MPDLTLTPSEAIALSESITSITIHEIKIDPSRDVLTLTAVAGRRAVVVKINNSNADPEADPAVVGDYDAVMAQVDLPAITALLQPAVEAAFAD